MEFIAATLIALILGVFVFTDATNLHNEETEVFGASDIKPSLWGIGSFLLAIAFVPAYLFVRSSANKRLLDARVAAVARKNASIGTAPQGSGWEPWPTSGQTVRKRQSASAVRTVGQNLAKTLLYVLLMLVVLTFCSCAMLWEVVN